MAAAPSDYESLVQSIMQVLTPNPALLAPLFATPGGAPVHCVGGHCVGCGHCVSTRADTVRGFREIAEGKHDDIPEQAFYMQGTIEEALQRAEELKKA